MQPTELMNKDVRKTNKTYLNRAPLYFFILLAWEISGQTHPAADTTDRLFSTGRYPTSRNNNLATNRIAVDRMIVHPESGSFDLVQSEIWQIEADECTALKQRDTTALKKIWARDFSQDAPPSGVVAEQSSLPYYVFLNRTIENLQTIGEFVYTNGFEMVQVLDPYKEMQPSFRRSYKHVWAKRNGHWILISKFVK